MRQVIEGKIYDTDTAEAIAHGENWHGDFRDYSEDLYRTKKGAYFLAGHGGPMSHWARPSGNNSWTGGSGIQPINDDEALAWMERHSDSETIERYFTIEEA